MSSGFFVHVFLITPVTNYFLESKNYPRPKGLYYALGFLMLAATASVWYELKDTEVNYYRFMEIDRGAGMADIKRAYRKKSIELHPDKNPNNPNADSEFAKLGAMNEVLVDKRLREAYDTWGPERVELLRDKRNAAQDSENQMLINMSMFYVVWSVLGYFLTLGKCHERARQFYYGGLIALACFEFSCKFMNGDHLSFIRRYTIYEQIDMLHRIFPAYLNACRMLSQATFVDEEKFLQLHLEQLHLNQRQIMQMLFQVIQNTDKKGRAKASVEAGVDPMNNPSISPEVKENLAKAEAMMGTAPRLNQGANPKAKAKETKSGGFNITNIIWMVCVYTFFNYVLG